MEPPMAAHLDRRPPASVAPDLPEDVCDLIIDIIMESLLKSRRRRTFAFAGWEDMELHREELRCRTTLAAGARVSKAWHSPFQYRLTQHIWLSSDSQFARLASHAYTVNLSLVQEISMDPSGQGVCNTAPYACHCVIGLLAQFPSAAKLSLCGVAWRVHVRCRDPESLAMHQHITRLALVWVQFQSISHLQHLLQALPLLQTLECSHVFTDDDDDLPPMPHCAALRDLRILDVDKRIAMFLGGVDERIVTFFGGADGCNIPSIDILSIAMDENFNGWLRYQELLYAYSESVRELNLMLHIQDEFALDWMVPGKLAEYKKLQKIALTLRVAPVPRFYSCFALLLANLPSENISEISLSFRPMSIHGDDVCLEQLVPLLDMSPALCDLDDILMHSQFMGIRKQGVRIELVTSTSELNTIFDEALRAGGGWEASVRQCMPRSDAAGLLRCVRRVMDPLDLNVF